MILGSARVAILAWLILLSTDGQLMAAGPDLVVPGIIDADERRSVDQAGWPWSAIGRINVAGQDRKQFCTGSLIGPRHVLTAAHCLIHPQTGRIIPHAIHFVAGYSRGEYLAHSVGEQVICGAGDVCQASSGAASPRWPPEQDWAVVVLRKEIELQPIPISPLSSGIQTVTRAGYSRDRAHILSAHYSCLLTAALDTKQLSSHECDGTHGDSGSPLLVGSHRDFRLVGLNIGFVRTGERTRGLAISANVFAETVRRLRHAADDHLTTR